MLEVETQIRQLDVFEAELAKAATVFPDQMRKASLGAAQLVAKVTEGSLTSRDGAAPLIAPTVEALTTERGAMVRMGGDSAPDIVYGIEFGGGAHGAGNPTPAGGHTTQFDPYKGSAADAGYSLFPSLYGSSDKIVETYGQYVDDLLKRAFPD